MGKVYAYYELDKLKSSATSNEDVLSFLCLALAEELPHLPSPPEPQPDAPLRKPVKSGFPMWSGDWYGQPTGHSRFNNSTCFFTGRPDDEGKWIALKGDALAQAKLLATAITCGVILKEGCWR